jgi:DnaJ-like protein
MRKEHAVTETPSRYESLIDQHIRMAQERGDFDDLPGMGKPLPGRGRRDDDLWWLKGYLRREGLSTEALLPTSLRLARQVERIHETVGRLSSEQGVRAAVADLNQQIADYLRAPSGPHVPIRPVDPDAVVARWRAGE